MFSIYFRRTFYLFFSQISLNRLSIFTLSALISLWTHKFKQKIGQNFFYKQISP